VLDDIVADIIRAEAAMLKAVHRAESSGLLLEEFYTADEAKAMIGRLCEVYDKLVGLERELNGRLAAWSDTNQPDDEAA
jgi:hypothetical protein